MRLALILLIFFFSLFGGRPTEKAEIYLEKGKQLVAFQVSGEKGKAAFSHLDAGSYRILIVFPQQEGKFIADKARHRSLVKAAFNPRNKTYYYQGTEGYFAIHFSGFSSIKNENFVAVFKEEKDEDSTYEVLVEFGAHRNNAGITVRVETLTAAQFKKASGKKDLTTISMLSIPNLR